MPMNIVIQEQRKLLGLTQEQVADYLGVSTPAVSKWEKGITSPDIGLLPPLARLLKIDLNTLFCFSEDLSEQEIGFFCNELAKQARNDILSAFDAACAAVYIHGAAGDLAAQHCSMQAMLPSDLIHAMQELFLRWNR